MTDTQNRAALSAESTADVNERSVLQQALDALEYHQQQTRPISKTEAVIEALRAFVSAHAAKPADVGAQSDDKVMQLIEEHETAAILYGDSKPDSDREQEFLERMQVARESLRAHLRTRPAQAPEGFAARMPGIDAIAEHFCKWLDGYKASRGYEPGIGDAWDAAFRLAFKLSAPVQSPPQAQPVGLDCDFCKSPLYAGTKCKNCGRVSVSPPQAGRVQEPTDTEPPSTQDVMRAVFEYARLMDGFDALEGDDRIERRKAAFAQDRKIRVMLAAHGIGIAPEKGGAV